MDDKATSESSAPDLGNFDEYSQQLKAIFESSVNQTKLLYDRLKAAILTGDITVNTVYLPANFKVFSIVFYHKDLSETVIRAIVNEDVDIVDPLIEHRNDIVKAIENSIWFDVFLKDVTERVFTLDMHRSYWKTRNRNRSVYYGAKELAAQVVLKGKYEKLG